MLLGRPAQLTIGEHPQAASTKEQCLCQIVCVKHKLFTDYSVHVKFNQALTAEQMTDMGFPK